MSKKSGKKKEIEHGKLEPSELETLDRLCERGEMAMLPKLHSGHLSALIRAGYAAVNGRRKGLDRVFPTRAGMLIKARRDALRKLI